MFWPGKDAGQVTGFLAPHGFGGCVADRRSSISCLEFYDEGI